MFPVKDYSILKLEISQLSFCLIMMAVLLQDQMKQKLLGIKMGEPYFKAKDIILKNKVYVFSSNYSLYGDLSRRVMRTLKRFNPELEIYSSR